MLEADARRALVKRYRGPRCMINSIETPSTGGKVPDLFLRSATTSWWIEIKRIIKAGGIIDWRPGQIEWAQQYMSLGGDYALVVTFGDVFYIFKNPVILPKRFAAIQGRTNTQSMSKAADECDTIHGLPDNLWIV